jgi:DNA-directed RNA polymerase subunit beta'
VHIPNGDRPVEVLAVPDGSEVLVPDGAAVRAGTLVAAWDPHSVPILSDRARKVHLADLVEGQTVRTESDPAPGARQRVTLGPTSDLSPRIEIRPASAGEAAEIPLRTGAILGVVDGQDVVPATLLTRLPGEATG